MLDDIRKTLWAAADKLRANMDAAEVKPLVAMLAQHHGKMYDRLGRLRQHVCPIGKI